MSDPIAEDAAANVSDKDEIAARFREAQFALENANRSMEQARMAALKANTYLWVASKLADAFAEDYPQYKPQAEGQV